MIVQHQPAIIDRQMGVHDARAILFQMAALFGGAEGSSVEGDGVDGLAVGDGLEEARVLVGVILEVGVLHDDHVARGGGEPGAERGALSLVEIMEDDLVDQRHDLGAEQVAGAVARAVVDDDDLLVLDRGGPDAVDDGADGLGLVVARDDDRELHGAGKSYFAAGMTEANSGEYFHRRCDWVKDSTLFLRYTPGAPIPSSFQAPAGAGRTVPAAVGGVGPGGGAAAARTGIAGPAGGVARPARAGRPAGAHAVRSRRAAVAGDPDP